MDGSIADLPEQPGLAGWSNLANLAGPTPLVREEMSVKGPWWIGSISQRDSSSLPQPKVVLPFLGGDIKTEGVCCWGARV